MGVYDFVELLTAVLVEERGHTKERANFMIKSNPGIVTNGIMSGTIALRGTALALEMSKLGPDTTTGEQ